MQQPAPGYVHPPPSRVHVHLAAGVIVLRCACRSSMPMLDFVPQVAAGPEALAIEQTLCRTRAESLPVGTILRHRRGARDAGPRRGQPERKS